ncbi:MULTISPECIES: 3-mercaptopyruvate sulfurtransferase [unclassified Iodidimonas]|jgi:thiosulfate/3-mercaptopyruvate sulfurtransferase|uniref:3-mercaptopyruvate sulfurtransferase n=1 Tax=unclassified Iodidimonas TaxID=2626145 RepID=UPI0024831862|nr:MULTISPECIES: 3-mercaptopyruvate sulfurtransferase [unclassified Iodidimonas]
MKPQAPSPLVSTDWLEQHLSAPDIRVLDASWHLPDSDHDARADYGAAHIPGAVFFNLDEISDPDTELPHMLPEPEAFSSAMRRLGIGDGSTIIVYDTGDLHSAARAWWMFRVFGQRDVFVLDGGLGKWRRENRPLEDLPPGPRERHFSARRHDNLVADLDAAIKASTHQTAQILDARGNPRFLGQEPEPRAGVEPGHIPGAINVPYGSLYQPDGTLKSPQDLQQIFKTAGVDLKKPVITSCGSGVTACSIALALTAIGHRDWSVYDGSWAEYGSQPTLPKITAAKVRADSARPA